MAQLVHALARRGTVASGARTRSERLLFAERLRAETALAHERRLSDRQLRHLLRPFAAGGWTVAGVLWGIDHVPDGNAHAFAWSSPTDLRNPAGWLAWRALATGGRAAITQLWTPSESVH